MRFATIQAKEGPRAVVRHNDMYVDLQASDSSIPNSIKEILASKELLDAASKVAQNGNAIASPVSEAKYHSPVPDPMKIIGVGLNYRDHAEESGAKIPAEPILFSKYPTSLIGHEETIILPKVSEEVDYEAELIIVIGKGGRPKDRDEAMAHIAGYTVGHDVSARDWQLKKDGRQWMVGKTFDTFAPVGPEIVTVDEAPDPHQLAIRLRLNGSTMQDSNTHHLIFGVGEVVAYLAKIFTLSPGDLIFTGTPPGVGFARKPPIYLKDGDVTEVEIEGLGILRNPVKQEP